VKILSVIVVLSILLTSPLCAQERKAESPAGHGQASKCGEEATAADEQALKRDLEKMRSLVQQMQRNLAAAATGQTPLKHQFELEIDMWQIMIGELERKVENNCDAN
jgi:hypothetical protein